MLNWILKHLSLLNNNSRLIQAKIGLDSPFLVASDTLSDASG